MHTSLHSTSQTSICMDTSLHCSTPPYTPPPPPPILHWSKHLHNTQHIQTTLLRSIVEQQHNLLPIISHMDKKTIEQQVNLFGSQSKALTTWPQNLSANYQSVWQLERCTASLFKTCWNPDISVESWNLNIWFLLCWSGIDQTYFSWEF